jgi:hypothetical protein
MQVTVLDLPDVVNKLLEQRGDLIVNAVESETRKDDSDVNIHTSAETSKLRVNLFLEIKKHIEAQGKIYHDEEMEAVRIVTELTEKSKAALALAAAAIEKLEKNWDTNEGKKVWMQLDPITKACDEVAQLKQDMNGHFKFRAGFANTQLCTKVLGTDMYNRLNIVYLGCRKEAFDAYAGLKDKFVKLEEYKKRAEHFVTMLQGLKGGVSEKKEVIELLGNDQQLIKKNETEFNNLVNSALGACKSGVSTLKPNADATLIKTTFSSIQENERKLKMAKSLLATSRIVSDGFLKKAGDLASLADTKKLAEQLKKRVAEMEKQIPPLVKVLTVYKETYTKVAPKDAPKLAK